ncbi:MAG: DMT family transporter [Pseudomonadota bacterium]
MSDAILGYGLALGALLFFTSGILVTKVASRRIDLGLGFLVATTVNVVFSGLAFLVQLSLRQGSVGWNAYAFWMFLGAGVFATYFGRWFFYEAVIRFGPAKASIFQVSSPLFTALMAWVLLGERLSALVVFGIVLAISGLMLVSYTPGFFWKKPSANAAVEKAPAGFLPTSILVLGLGSSLAYAVGNLLRGAGVREWNEPVLGGFLGATCGLLLHLAFTPAKMQLLQRFKTASRSGVWLYAALGVCTISGQILGIAAMRYIPLSIATLLTLCTPLLVFPLSYLFFKNQGDMTPVVIGGSALTLLGIFIIVLR